MIFSFYKINNNYKKILIFGFLIIILGLLGFSSKVYADFYSWNQASNLGLKDYSKVAISADGQYQYAISSDINVSVYSSSDYGNTWSATSPDSSPHNWSSITTSASGAIVFVSSLDDYVYMSTDYGLTWSTINPYGYPSSWGPIALSGNGNVLYVENNSNAQLMQSPSPFNSFYNLSNFYEVSSLDTNTDGSCIVALISNYSNNVRMSHDSGGSVQEYSVPGATDIAVSDDCTKAVVGTNAGTIYVYSSGTWSQASATGFPGDNITAVDMNADGRTIVVTTSIGGVFVSRDEGISFRSEDAAISLVSANILNDIVVTSSGSGLVVASSNNYLYTALDTIAPTISSATVNGNKLIITFNEPIAGNSPSLYNYLVHINTAGEYPQAADPVVSNNILTLTLNEQVVSSDIVTFDYTNTNTAHTQDLSGNDLVNVASVAVTNISPALSGGGGSSYNTKFNINKVVTNTSQTSSFVSNIPVKETTSSASTSETKKTTDDIKLIQTSEFGTNPFPATFLFTRNQTQGNLNIGVKNLQIFLNANGYIVSKTGNGSPGKENSRFGPGTKAALIKFQKDHNITPASGYFGPVTRSFVNAILKGVR